MSYPDRWCTKADILKDLAEVTGLRDVDEKYIVRGKEPPPMLDISGDDDLNLRFGNHLYEQDHVTPAPDLNGISHMLRMVDEYNGDSEDSDEVAPMKPSDHIIISKLNPEVLPFVPKSADTNAAAFKLEDFSTKLPNTPEISAPSVQNGIVSNGAPEVAPKDSASSSSRSSSENRRLNKKIDVSESTELYSDKNKLNKRKECYIDILKKTPISKDHTKLGTSNLEAKTNFNTQQSDTEFNIGKRIEVSKLNADEIKNITMKLRSKISGASKKDNLQSKREKNVAIATILKLYSVTPSQAGSPKHENSADDDDDDKPIKLFTPEYFETRPAVNNLGANKVICEVHGVDVDVESESNSNSPGPSKISKDSLENGKTSNKTSTSSNRHIEDAKKSITPKFVVENSTDNISGDHVVQNSIEKVNKWFDKPESPKPKGPSVFLGPIAFKRKTPVTRSPVSEMEKSNRSTPSSLGNPEVAQYRPSKYAEDLSKKFMEQGKALEKRQMDVWQRAELQMKEKEELMKKKTLESSTSQEGSERD